MGKDNNEDQEVKTKTDLAKMISMDMLKEFLSDAGFHDEKIVCASCGCKNFVIPAGDTIDGVTYPIAVTMPIPTKPGKGIWNFMAVCERCSNTLFYNVGYLVTVLEKAGKL